MSHKYYSQCRNSYFRMSNLVPKISIVTVTFNASAVIEKTLQSVINQTYKNIEYIIIDGASKDNTLEIVEKYSAHIATIVSERDKNNYDAMNKGLARATGDYVWFLHAGDFIPSPTALEEAMLHHHDEDFIYGKVRIYDANGTELAWHKPHPSDVGLSWRSFQNGMIVCHQAMLMKRTIAATYNFEAYPLVADLDWTIRSLLQAKTFRDAGVYLCSFLAGGISHRNRRRSLWERFAIMRQHFGLLPTLWEHVRIAGQALRRGSISNH